MASSTTKKVQVWRFDRELVAGFVNPGTYLTEVGAEILTVAGSLATVPYPEIKVIYFVRDFEKAGATAPKRAFLTRPKLDGLWVRLTFRDGDQLEGVMPNNLLGLEYTGFSLMPPDFAGNNQRAFIPRSALGRVQVLGVVGSPLNRPARKKLPGKDQIGLFEDAG